MSICLIVYYLIDLIMNFILNYDHNSPCNFNEKERKTRLEKGIEECIKILYNNIVYYIYIRRPENYGNNFIFITKRVNKKKRDYM